MGALFCRRGCRCSLTCRRLSGARRGGPTRRRLVSAPLHRVEPCGLHPLRLLTRAAVVDTLVTYITYRCTTSGLECDIHATQISGLHFEVLGNSESDSRVNVGSRKHVAMIMRNSEVWMYANIKSAASFKKSQVWHFSPKLAPKCRNVSTWPTHSSPARRHAAHAPPPSRGSADLPSSEE